MSFFNNKLRFIIGESIATDNNNPFGLVASGIGWLGKKSPIAGLESFETKELGIRAGIINLANSKYLYKSKDANGDVSIIEFTLAYTGLETTSNNALGTKLYETIREYFNNAFRFKASSIQNNRRSSEFKKLATAIMISYGASQKDIQILDKILKLPKLGNTKEEFEKLLNPDKPTETPKEDEKPSDVKPQDNKPKQESKLYELISNFVNSSDTELKKTLAIDIISGYQKELIINEIKNWNLKNTRNIVTYQQILRYSKGNIIDYSSMEISDYIRKTFNIEGNVKDVSNQVALKIKELLDKNDNVVISSGKNKIEINKEGNKVKIDNTSIDIRFLADYLYKLDKFNIMLPFITEIK